jgi:Nucleotidyl transferase AbiEii toxin, Type IV TA system
MRRSPLDVLPKPVADAVADQPHWFVIGGQAVRCLCPYRPSRDVDFGVASARNARELIQHLERRGKVELLERSSDTTHLTFDGVDVSIFVLKRLASHVEDAGLSVEALLATKLHAILDRGTRRDFFDLYVLMQLNSFGVVDCIRAMQEIYETDVNHGLLLRALSYFDDAEAEPPLPGEGSKDWESVQAYFSAAVAALLVPPLRPLEVQSAIVDVRTTGDRPSSKIKAPPQSKRRTKVARK